MALSLKTIRSLDLRYCIIGKSSAGKTKLIISSAILEDGILDWNNSILCGKSHHQIQYKVLIGGLSKGLSKSQIRSLCIHHKRVDKEGGIETFL